MTIPIVALVLLGSAFLSAPAGASTQQDLNSAQGRLSALLHRIDAAANERDALRSHLVALLERADAGRRAVESTQARIVDEQLSLRGIADAIDTQQSAVDRRAALAYMQGPIGSLAVVLGSTSFQDMSERLADLDAAAREGARANADLSAQREAQASKGASLVALYRTQRATQDRLDADAAAIGADLQRQQAIVDGLDRDRARLLALVKTLRDRRQRELAQEALRRSRSGGSPPPAPPHGEQMKVRNLIVYYFTPQGQFTVNRALCVGWRESRYIPTAVNKYSGAAGVFQFMPNLWPWFSSTAGWKGANVFDPVANVAVAAYIVDHFGWSPWRSDHGACGV